MRTRPRWSGLLLALLVAATSAGAQVPRVVLEQAGEAPRAPLRFQPRAGASALFEAAVEQDLLDTRGDTRVTLTAFIQSDVRRVDPDGGTEVLTWLAGLSLAGTKTKGLDEALSHTLGLEVRGRVDARGLTSRATLGMRGQPLPHPPELLRTLVGDLTRHIVPLPEEAVGVGARWTVEDTPELLGARVRRRATYQLVSRAADRADLDVAFSVDAEDVKLDGALGGNARLNRLKRLKGEGSSRMRLQLTEAPGGELDVTLLLVMEPEPDSGHRVRTHEGAVRLRVARVERPLPFVRWKDGVPESLGCAEGTAPEEVWHEGREPGAIAWRCVRPDGTPHGPVVGLALTGLQAFVGEYRDGLRSGTWRVWDRPGSEEPSVSTWREGRLDGRNEERDPRTGALEVGEWRNGLKEGDFELRDARGVVRARGTYIRGAREGTWRSADGRFEEEYRGGKRQGLHVLRDEAGAEVERGTWREGRKHGEWVLRREGGAVERRVYHDGKLWTGLQTVRLPPEERDGAHAEGALREGKRQGPWTEWDSDVRLQRLAAGRYVDGRREGVWRTWHGSGMGRDVLASEGAWRRDVRVGRWTFFDEQGRRVRVQTWRDGVLDGPSTLFHGNGRKREEGRFRKGLQDGTWKRWSEDGTRMWSGHFAAGRPVGRWLVRHGAEGVKPVVVKPDAPCPPWAEPLAEPTARRPFSGCADRETGEPEGAWVRLHETYGYVAEEGTFARGLREGEWKLYYPSGNLLARGPYRAGLKDGRWTYFHDAKDRVLVEAEYTSGRRSGPWHAFHADGRPWLETRYTLRPEDERSGSWTPERLSQVQHTPPHSLVTATEDFPEKWLTPGGAPDEERTAEAFHRVLHANGKAHTEGLWRRFRPVGVHRTWDADGREVEVVDHEAGTRSVAAGPGTLREERVRQVDAKTSLTRRWDARGQLVWLARTGEAGSIHGGVTVWDSGGAPRWYLGASRGVLHGPFRLPGPPGQPDLTGHALLNEVIELQPDPCPPGSQRIAALEQEVTLLCMTRGREAALTAEWAADLTLKRWSVEPDKASAEARDPGASQAPGVTFAQADEVSRYPDGKLRWEKVLQEDGQRRYRAWYPDGTLREEGAWRGDRPEGTWRGFASNGALVWEGRYEDGKPVGVWQGWYEDGSRRSRHGFAGWRFARFWRRDGSLWKEGELGRDGLELWRWYSPEGTLQAEGTLKQGRPIGPWRLALGGAAAPESRSHDEDARLEWSVPATDGRARLEVLMLGGEATGTWRLSDARGARHVSLRLRGQVLRQWTRNAEGVLVAMPVREAEDEPPSQEPPPWQGDIDDEAPPLMPEELTASATP